MKSITSRDNAVFKGLCRLAEHARERRRLGQTLLDGTHLCKALAAAGQVPIELIVSDHGLAQAEIRDCLDGWPQVPVLHLSDGLFNAVAPVDTPSGLLARIAIPLPTAEAAARDTLVIDGVQDPGNLGGLLRTAAAAGFAQAVLSSDCAQAWGPRALRAGMGAQLRMAVFEQVDLPNFLAHFPGRRLVTGLDAAVSLYALDLRRGPLAWVFGNEGQGVRAAVRARADACVMIPMPGQQVESLNVAAAAAVCLFETLRQRSSG